MAEDPASVSIALDDPPMEPEPDWTRLDILSGCRIREWTIDRGRPTEFAKTDTGTAVVRIVDMAGLFDPTNTTSPYHGKVLPGKQAAIALQYPLPGFEWHTLFRGFVESWQYRLDPTRQYMELELQLVDGFAILARAQLEVGVDGAIPPYVGMPAEQAATLAEMAKGNVLYGESDPDPDDTGTVGDRINAILGDVDWPVGLRSVFTGNVRVGPKAYGPGTSALDALWDAADAEFPGVANLFIGGPGVNPVGGSLAGLLVFRGRQARFRPTIAEYGIQRRTVGDPSAWNDTADPHYLEVVPVAELEWSNGQDNLFNACTATPQWVGSGATIRQLNPDPPDNDDVAGQLVKDDTSVDAYGLRSLTFDNLQTVEGIHTGNDSMVETKLFATYYVENYSTPEPRITRMVFKSRHPTDPHAAALWNHLCRCDISDLLTLKTEHPGGGGFDDDYYVEGIHYTCRPGGPVPIVELSLDVSPRAAYTSNPFDADPNPEL